MNISHLNVGIIHSLIGKNDGVSIVIDQTVNAMIGDMGIELGNIFFLAAHTSPRFNAETDEIFWHKNEIHKEILINFSKEASPDLDKIIHEGALYAKKIIKKWVEKNSIDLIIAHNTSHPYNFVTAVGLGYLIEEYREQGIIWPKLMVWWHDSYFERTVFANPNAVVKKYLKYLPGTYIDGLAFINNTQPDLAKRLFEQYNEHHTEKFFKQRAIVVPNTSDIPWEWKSADWNQNALVFPKQDNYNNSFFHDIGLLDQISEKGYTLDNTIILLQHTRIVPRKKIETAIDFAFKIEQKFTNNGHKKCIALLVSGHSGDEQNEYKKFLIEYFDKKQKEHPEQAVVLNFGESNILSHRDIIVDKKYYKFAEIPSIVAARGGLGTYFSEVEGFGNNLLEMVSLGLPVIINKYDVYKSDIEQLNFDFPSVENCELSIEAIDRSYQLLTDINYRNKVIKHNLEIVETKLDHKIIADKLNPLITRMFTQTL